jgi:hypothetical protein
MKKIEDMESKEKLLKEAQEAQRAQEQVNSTPNPTATANSNLTEEQIFDITHADLSKQDKKELREMKRKHTCQEADVESLKEIRAHSRPCPNCKARIFRIAGCDTMWCTLCNTGFNWRTGLIIKDAKGLHNPHYVDFIKKNPNFQYNVKTEEEKSEEEKKTAAMVIDNPCDRVTLESFVSIDLNYMQSRMRHLNCRLRDCFNAFQQQMGHMLDYSRGKFIHGNEYNEVGYALNYITDEWDEKQWRIRLEHHDRFRQTNEEYADVMLTWLVVMKDLLNGFISLDQTNLTIAKADEILKQMQQISEYTNNTLEGMNKIYKRKTNLIKVPICEAPAQWTLMSDNVKNILRSIGIMPL